MAKVTTSRHLLLTLAVVLIAATGLMFWGFMSNPAYADDRGDVREIELNNAEDSDLWSDDTLRYDVQIPADVDYDSIRWIVGVRGEDDWEIVLGDRDNVEKYYEYNADRGELLLHGDKIFDEIREEHLDIYVNVKNGGNVVAEGFAGVDVRESRYEYDLPQDDNILPEWDGWVDRSLRVWVENKENPDGNEYERSIIEIKPVSENPGKILKMREDFYGWSYDGIDCGTVRFCVTYTDLGGEERTHYFNVNVSETVYDANLWAPEGVYQGLPGTEIDLEASAVKHTATRQGDGWRHDSTSDGLNLSWSFEDEDSSRFAEMRVSDDPAKATVCFKDIDEEWIDEWIGVRVGVTDEESTPSIERTSNRTGLFMRSEYYQIYPATIDSSLDVGKITRLEPEVRFYRYGQEGYSAVEEPTFEIEEYDPNAIVFSEENGVFTITRIGDWDTHFNIWATWKNGDNRDESIDQWYHLDRKNYDAWFKYDHKDIYADQSPVHIEIETEDLDGIVDDINDPTNDDYELSYTIGVWDDNQEEFVYTMPIETYSGDFEGLHFDARDFKTAVNEARNQFPDKDIDGLNARVQLIVAGNVIQDNWTWLNLRETCMENGHEDHSWIKQTIREKTCIDPGRQVWICLDDPVWGGCGEVRWFDYAGDSDELGPCALIKIPAKAPTLTAPGNIEHYKCKVCEKLYSDANGQKEITPESVVINKKPNPLTIKAKTATVKYSKLKKKNQTLAVTKVIAFTQKGQGAMTYSKVSGSKKITINKTSGKVTVKKGLKKGTYKIKVKAKAAGNADYIASDWKTVTFKIKVK